MKRANVFIIAIVLLTVTYIFAGNNLEGEDWQTVLGYALGVLIGVFGLAFAIEYFLAKFRSK